MKKYFYTPPFVVKKIFSGFIWENRENKNLITFDDGPNPTSTEIILKVLEQNKTKAIFFCVGENILKYKSLTRKILDEGHEIGNHTMSHQNIIGRYRKDIIADLEKFNKILFDEFGYKVNFFRPPHGRFGLNSQKIIEQTGLRNVMWTLLTQDYKNDINIVKFAFHKYLKENSIIVFHDSNKSKAIIEGSLNEYFEITEELDFKIGAAAECLN